MTPQQPATTSKQPPSPSDPDSRRKTALFCPTCGHESEITGDWIVRTENARRMYDCPDCDTTLTDPRA